MDGRVQLRAVVEADLPIFFEHQRDPESNAMAAFPARDREAFDAHWAKILADPTTTNRAIPAFLRIVTARPLVAHVAKHNVASRRVLEKSGFVVVEESKADFEGTEIGDLTMRLEQ